MPGIIGSPNILQVALDDEQAIVSNVEAIKSSAFENVVSSLEVSSAERASPPTAAQCAVHLVLLESIINLKSKVEQWGAAKAFDSETSWQYYLSLASARFAIFTSSMRRNKSSSWNKVPPLDILIVWHAFMLNPRTYSRFGKTVPKMAWIERGINWNNLRKLLSPDNAGFIFDSDSRVWLQEAVLHPDLLVFLECNESQPIIEQLQGKTTAALSLPASAAVKELATAVDTLHRNNNIFHIDSFKFDLISAVNRQLKFAAKMTSFAWRHSPFFHATLASAITRYQHFFEMMKEHSQLAPTLDVDLVWHTHQLMPSAYWGYSREVAGRFVNHDDMISEDTAGLSFRNAISVYEKSFRESYSLCFCLFCEASRHSELPVVETVHTVENALETEIARRLNTGLLVNGAFTKVHCSKWACYPTMKSVLTDGEECEADCEALGACNGQPWCEADCDSGGCNGDSGDFDESDSRK